MCAVKYKLNLNKIQMICETARKTLCQQIIQDTKQYVPNSGGKLERSVRVTGKGNSIVYRTPYAQYLWHGKLMLAANGSSWAKSGEKKHLTNIDLKYNKSINPKAGKYWVARAKEEKMKNWIRAIKEELRRTYGVHTTNIYKN